MNEREQEPKFDAAAVRSAKSMALGDSEATPVYIAAKITAEYAPLVEAAREMWR